MFHALFILAVNGYQCLSSLSGCFTVGTEILYEINMGIHENHSQSKCYRKEENFSPEREIEIKFLGHPNTFVSERGKYVTV
jgi:hypothetical protein